MTYKQILGHNHHEYFSLFFSMLKNETSFASMPLHVQEDVIGILNEYSTTHDLLVTSPFESIQQSIDDVNQQPSKMPESLKTRLEEIVKEVFIIDETLTQAEIGKICLLGFHEESATGLYYGYKLISYNTFCANDTYLRLYIAHIGTFYTLRMATSAVIAKTDFASLLEEIKRIKNDL